MLMLSIFVVLMQTCFVFKALNSYPAPFFGQNIHSLITLLTITMSLFVTCVYKRGQTWNIKQTCVIKWKHKKHNAPAL